MIGNCITHNRNEKKIIIIIIIIITTKNNEKLLVWTIRGNFNLLKTSHLVIISDIYICFQTFHIILTLHGRQLKMHEFSPVQDKRFTSSVDIFNFDKRIPVKGYKQHDQQK